MRVLLLLLAALAASVSSQELDGFITRGRPARIGQFPYQVGLSIKLAGNRENWCGGSLINEFWVLTAAHCTDGAQSITLFLGGLSSRRAPVMPTVRRINIAQHRQYDRNTLENDIALVRVPRQRFTNNIRPIRLPKLPSINSTFAGQGGIASGWGWERDPGGRVADNLRWAPMPIMANAPCVAVFGSRRVKDSNICVSTTGGVSICNGDSGGPLVLSRNRMLVGVASFVDGRGCTRGSPAVFTRVTKYLQWIKAITGININ